MASINISSDGQMGSLQADLSGGMLGVTEAISGVSGTLLATLATYPIDIAKTKIQLQAKGLTKTEYSGLVDVLLTIFRRQGIQGLFRGVRGEIIKESVRNFTSFFWYSYFKEIVKRVKAEPIRSGRDADGKPIPKFVSEDDQAVYATAQHDFWTNILLGIASSTITVFVLNPLTVAQIRIQSRKKKDMDAEFGILRTMFHVIRTNGFRSLYAGLLPSLILTLNPAIQLAVYDVLKAVWKNFRYFKLRRKLNTSDSDMKYEVDEDDPSALGHFVMGAAAKAVATFVTYPYILAKVMLAYKGDPQARRFTGIFHILLSIIKSKGILGIYQGMKPQLLKSMLAAGIVFMAKAKLQRVFWIPFTILILKLFGKYLRE
eukprot:126598_1